MKESLDAYQPVVSGSLSIADHTPSHSREL